MSAPSKYGYFRDPHDPRDFLVDGIPYGAAELPPRVSRSASTGPVFDQGDSSECVAYSVAGLKRYQAWSKDKQWPSLDVDGFYQACKAVDGSPDTQGTFPRAAMQVLQQTGIKAADGTVYKIASYSRCASVSDIKVSLATEGPVVVGLHIYDVDWNNLTPGSVIPVQVPPQAEGHCILFVGYDDLLEAFQVRNSWGADWGEDGHCWIPYNYLTQVDPDFDAWTGVAA